MSNVSMSKEEVFLTFLKDNGAKIDKITWPSSTASGSRGTVANVDIATNEPIFEIPTSLMMSPLTVFSDKIVGEAFKSCQDILKGDLLLSFYIVYHVGNGTQSFYYPYLSILPEPDCLMDWSESELHELQDESLYFRSRRSVDLLESTFKRKFAQVNSLFPEIFRSEVFQFPIFKFAWNTVQSRAFGRRLPWVALVPFADCLNHTNVQTKYDYNVDENGVFRLFPTGSNCYHKGDEVFNSYGRRPNDNLLSDYGFAILNNEWDFVGINTFFEEKIEGFARSALCRKHGVGYYYLLKVAPFDIPINGFPIFRIRALSEEEAYSALDSADQDFSSPISFDNEKRALQLVISRIQEVLAKFPTSVDEDEALLTNFARSNSDDSNTQQTYRLNAAVVYRLTRKRILTSLIYKLTIIINAFDSNVLNKWENLKLEISNHEKQWIAAQNRTDFSYIDSLQHLSLPMVD